MNSYVVIALMLLGLAGILLLLKWRGKPLWMAFFLYFGMPSAPTGLPGLAWMFPGRGEAGDPDPRPALSGPPNPHETSSPPAGLKQLSSELDKVDPI